MTKHLKRTIELPIKHTESKANTLKCHKAHAEKLSTISGKKCILKLNSHLSLFVATLGIGTLCTVPLFSGFGHYRCSGAVMGGERCCVLAPDWSTS